LKYFIIAAEVSGDMHSSQLVKHIQAIDKDAVFIGVGGPALQAANVKLIFGLERVAFMGFFEVVKNIFTIWRNFKEVKNSILQTKPDRVILVDYAGFNLRIAKWCKQHHIKVAYYISPKIWAWNESRVEIIKKYVDVMLCVFPFEIPFYQKHQYTTAYFVGHPLQDSIAKIVNESSSTAKNHIALLPGSRRQEIKALLPMMLATTNDFPNEKFVIAGMSAVNELYQIPLPNNVSIVYDATYDVLQYAKAAIVCSGTATLETALFSVPQVVVYKTSWINYQIGKRLAKVRFISLPNLIVDNLLVKELIQDDCTKENCSQALELLLQQQSTDFYASLQAKLQRPTLSDSGAQLIVRL